MDRQGRLFGLYLWQIEKAEEGQTKANSSAVLIGMSTSCWLDLPACDGQVLDFFFGLGMTSNRGRKIKGPNSFTQHNALWLTSLDCYQYQGTKYTYSTCTVSVLVLRGQEMRSVRAGAIKRGQTRLISKAWKMHPSQLPAMPLSLDFSTLKSLKARHIICI